MNLKQVWAVAGEILGIELIHIGKTQVTVATVVVALLIVLAALALSRVVRAAVTRMFRRSGIDNEGSLATALRLIHYFVLVGGLVTALQSVGIDLSTMVAASAVIAVGFGFAMQSIAQNFVSGLILLVERSIKQGDVLEVDGRVVRVERMGIRSTLARTRHQEQLIIPNSVLAQSTVKNYSLSDRRHLLRAVVGVTYTSDMKRVRQVLEQVAQAVPWRVQAVEPRVLLLAFGDSSVNFEVQVCSDDPWRSRGLLADINEQIWWALRDAGITIAFPQLDVHLDARIQKSLDLLVTRAAA